MDSAYSQLKPLFHTERLESLRAGLVPAPVHVQLVLSDLCNHDCSFCAYRISNGLSSELFVTAETHNPNRRMSRAKAEEIIDDCARLGVRAIQFTGGGEPTVHPDHLAMFERAQDNGLDTALVTNGVRLDPSHPAVLALKWIRVSIDAGSRDGYARVRGVSAAHWDIVWSVLRTLAESYRGRLSVGYVVTNENYSEIAEFVMHCAANGVKSARVGAVFSESGTDYYRDKGEIRAALEAAEKVAKRQGVELANLFPRRLEDLRHGAPRESFCGYQYFTTYIGADLGVYRCCNTAYTTRGKVGDLREQTFVELWQRRIQADGFDATGCHFCQFNAQNAAIASAIMKPDDENFV